MTGCLTLLCCAVLPLTISCTFMGLYWKLFTVAADYDEAGGDGDFDRCFIKNVPTADELAEGKTITDGDTKWKVAFTLNAICYTLLSIWALVLVLSAIVWPLAYCGACCVCLTQCFHLACVIIAGVFRYSSDGEECADKEMPAELSSSSDSGSSNLPPAL